MAYLLYGRELTGIILGMLLVKKTTLWFSLGGFFAFLIFLTYLILIFSARPTCI
jgi:hypothetical protein